jgi:hypothetical protein
LCAVCVQLKMTTYEMYHYAKVQRRINLIYLS